MELRDASVADVDELSRIAYASKAHWGYDVAFMRACRGELTVCAEDLSRAVVRVAEQHDGVVGFHGVAPYAGDIVELTWLFVAPAAMGHGAGRALLADAVSVARRSGARALHIESDPHAVGFYERAGARRTGTVPSASIPGRALPALELAIV